VLLFYCLDGKVPAAMHVWKDIPGGNSHYFTVRDYQVYDWRCVLY